MNKKVLAVAVAALVAISVGLILWGPSRGQNKAGQQQPQRKEVIKLSTRIKWLPYASYIGTYVAKDWGIWNKNGLDVTIHEGGPQVDAIKLVAAGSDDFGICAAAQLLVAREKGIPVVAIAALMQESPCGFMVHEKSDIRSMADFEGKKIRVIPGHNTHIEYRAVMKKLGIDMSTITEVVNFAELQLFMAGEVDIEPIYINNQPATATAKGVQFRVLTPSDYEIRGYGNIYFTTEETIRERPEVVTDFLAGVLEGWENAFAQPEKALDSLLKVAPSLKRDIEKNKLKDTQPLMAREDERIGWMTKERWGQIAKTLLENDVLKQKPDIDALFTDRFLVTIYGDATN